MSESTLHTHTPGRFRVPMELVVHGGLRFADQLFLKGLSYQPTGYLNFLPPPPYRGRGFRLPVSV